MATKFGARPAVYGYYAKIRWLVGCLLTLILVLSGSLIYVAASPDEPPMVIDRASSDGATANTGSSEVEILIAAQRIERGAEYRDDFFSVHRVSHDELPVSPVLARDRSALHGLRATRMLVPGDMLTYDDVTRERAAPAIDIPPGYRLATILADAQQLGGGLVAPNDRVDLLFSYVDNTSRHVTLTLVRFAKVASINGNTHPGDQVPVGSGAVPVSLLVTEKDAKRMELARTVPSGRLSLSPLGITAMPNTNEGVEPIRLESILGSQPPPEEPEETFPGTLIVSDPDTGRPVTYKLTPKGWRRMPA